MAACGWVPQLLAQPQEQQREVWGPPVSSADSGAVEVITASEQDAAEQTASDVLYLAASPNVAWEQLRGHHELLRHNIQLFNVYEAHVSPPLEPSFVTLLPASPRTCLPCPACCLPVCCCCSLSLCVCVRAFGNRGWGHRTERCW